MRKDTLDTRFLLFGWAFYLIAFGLTERLIPAEQCHVIHCTLDDLIPFCEIFVVPYVLWYALIAGSLLYFLLYNTNNFRRLQIQFIITQVIAIFIYIAFPNRQELRPDFFPRENVFTWMVALLYSIDTNTGVCPSLHCAHSLSIASVWLKEPSASALFKSLIAALSLLICLSTLFIKQHSVLDFFAAIPVFLIAEVLTE